MPENMYVTESAAFNHLCEEGFTEDEATKLITLKEQLVERKSREMLAEQHRLDFIRWLVEHDRISD
ncbi:MAG TPA: hypothetical protein VGD98_00175 [Ktedonobacteraceae bacterium]